MKKSIITMAAVFLLGLLNSCSDSETKIPDVNISSGGSSVLTLTDCGHDATGTMLPSTSVSGVEQVVLVNVALPGSYNIATNKVNGVVFSASGVFGVAGAQTVVLKASGSPIASGDFSYTLNTTPSCSFVRAVAPDSSSGGSSAISSVVCNTASAGTILPNVPVAGVTQTVTVTVTRIGTYSLSTNAVSGITFSATGTFASLGSQTVVLTAFGTSTGYGNITFALSSTPSCSFVRTSLDPGTVVALDNRVWYTYNLGATAAAASSTDSSQYGDLYQWGRGKDGHELRTSATTATLSSGDVPGHGSFITSSGDWRSSANDNLWQGVSGVNNPCPSGYRLPTNSEWSAVISAEGITNAATGYSSRLKLVAAGFRDASGPFYSVGVDGAYWTSTVNGTYAYYRYIGASSTSTSNTNRAVGFSVRCIKD
jgi:uncharacterized protein (TIGR02145 family)